MMARRLLSTIRSSFLVFALSAVTVPAAGIWPFLAGDFELPGLSGRVGYTLTGGIGFGVSGREFRAEARAHFGPSAMAQFFEANERFFGLGIRMAL